MRSLAPMSNYVKWGKSNRKCATIYTPPSRRALPCTLSFVNEERCSSGARLWIKLIPRRWLGKEMTCYYANPCCMTLWKNARDYELFFSCVSRSQAEYKSPFNWSSVIPNEAYICSLVAFFKILFEIIFSFTVNIDDIEITVYDNNLADYL